MPFQPPFPAAALAAVLFLAACGSSSTDSPYGANAGPNGTLTMEGRTRPIGVGGAYDDTSLMIVAMTNFDGRTDTGWTFMLHSLPSVGTRPILPDTVSYRNFASHNFSDPDLDCNYSAQSGSIRIDSWTASGKRGDVKVSGGASLHFKTRSLLPTCADVSAELTFTNFLAGRLPQD